MDTYLKLSERKLPLQERLDVQGLRKLEAMNLRFLHTELEMTGQRSPGLVENGNNRKQ